MARREKAKGKLVLDRVREDLGELESLEDAQRWLTCIARWALAGMVSGTTAHASVRAVEIWVRTHESKLTQQVVEELEQELDRVKAELKGRRLRPVS